MVQSIYCKIHASPDKKRQLHHTMTNNHTQPEQPADQVYDHSKWTQVLHLRQGQTRTKGVPLHNKLTIPRTIQLVAPLKVEAMLPLAIACCASTGLPTSLLQLCIKQGHRSPWLRHLLSQVLSNRHMLCMPLPLSGIETITIITVA